MGRSEAALRALILDGKVRQGIEGALPVHSALRPVLPGGLRRDTPTTVAAVAGGLSLLLALIAGPLRRCGLAVLLSGRPDTRSDPHPARRSASRRAPNPYSYREIPSPVETAAYASTGQPDSADKPKRSSNWTV
jgi:hypothetical protein